MKAERDYYALLDVAETATEEELKRAYRRLALRHHPDRNPGDPRAEERFKAVSEAYAVLMNPGRRREYDAMRHARATGKRAGRPSWREEDLFRDLFSDPRVATVFDELRREWERSGLRSNETFVRDLFSRGHGVILIGPGRIRWRGPGGVYARVERAGAGPDPFQAPLVPTVAGLARSLWTSVRETFAGPVRALGQALGFPELARRRGDLQYEIAVTPDDLRNGARYRVTIRRAGRSEELLVGVPAGIREGTRLRLRGKGEPGPDGTLGDLFLRVRLEGRGERA